MSEEKAIVSAEEKQRAEKNRLIATTIAVGATPNELSLFLYQCNRTGLDPLNRQIYFIKSSGRVMIQVSIDGFRVIAQRSGQYAGQDEPVFTETPEKGLEKCAVTVYRFGPDGQRYPAAVGVAYKAEYHKPGGMWDKMPHTMLAKVAEALALRKAFPQDLSGLYSSEEMEQATPVVVQAEEVEPTGETEAGVPTGPSYPAEASDPIIEGYDKQISEITSEGGLTMTETRITTSSMTDDQKETIKGMITDRRQQLADDAMGLKTTKYQLDPKS